MKSECENLNGLVQDVRTELKAEKDAHEVTKKALAELREELKTEKDAHEADKKSLTRLRAARQKEVSSPIGSPPPQRPQLVPMHQEPATPTINEVKISARAQKDIDLAALNLKLSAAEAWRTQAQANLAAVPAVDEKKLAQLDSVMSFSVNNEEFKAMYEKAVQDKRNLNAPKLAAEAVLNTANEEVFQIKKDIHGCMSTAPISEAEAQILGLVLPNSSASSSSSST